jgi:hypothetical protein
MKTFLSNSKKEYDYFCLFVGLRGDIDIFW